MRLACECRMRVKAGLMVVSLAILPGAASMAQASGAPSAEAPLSAMEMTIVGTSLKGADGKIYVNENCEIFPGLTLPITSRKLPQRQQDMDVCHLEPVLRSDHPEETLVGSVLVRSNVEVREREYVLQNTTMQPQIFAVLQQVPPGWKVDSDPQPVRIEGEVAIFEAHAEPGETVRLHVGERRTKELKPKGLPATGGP